MARELQGRARGLGFDYRSLADACHHSFAYNVLQTVKRPVKCSGSVPYKVTYH